MVTFKSNGHTCDGYIAGSGPGVLVIQEWWGLVPHIKDVVDRFAAAGFTALAPDLYHGESSTEPDGAGKLMMALNLEQAGKDLSGAVALLQERSRATTRSASSATAWVAAWPSSVASQRPDAVAACAPYYGVIPWASAQPDWSAISATVVGEYAEFDDYAGPEASGALQAQLRELGKDATLHVHPGTHHAFFNDARPEVYDAAASAECVGAHPGAVPRQPLTRLPTEPSVTAITEGPRSLSVIPLRGITMVGCPTPIDAPAPPARPVRCFPRSPPAQR